ncbi:3-phosphoshikimate 1-carboxyvinyltransferase [bacterium]|nr:3-phosphoshikimate 1-carboxyvinyltransferase [bacterium]
MNITVSPHTISGSPEIPLSKSMHIRAMAIEFLTGNRLGSLSEDSCDDVRAMHHFIAKLDGGEEEIPCGESALVARMMAPIVALRRQKTVIKLSDSLKNRPMEMVADALGQLGVSVMQNSLDSSIEINGIVEGGEVTIDCAITSQMLTGLLIALPFAKRDSTIYVKNLSSTPYVLMTLEMLQNAGIVIETSEMQSFFIKGNQRVIPSYISVERDWSSAANLLVAGAIAGEISLREINICSLQADRAIVSVLEDVGADVSWHKTAISVRKMHLLPFQFDASQSPDLVPPLVALAAHCDGVSTITGVSRLRYKESDRLVALKTEFEKMGISIVLAENSMTITGGEVQGATLSSHGDHRIAMACAVAALAGHGDVVIKNGEVVRKSFPLFFASLKNS